MLSIELVWHGDELLARIEADSFKLLKQVAITLANLVKRNLNTTYPPASLKGEFPHKRTGALQRSITYEFSESEGKAWVGTNLRYGRYLETLMERSFLKRTLEESIHQLRALGGLLSE